MLCAKVLPECVLLPAFGCTCHLVPGAQRDGTTNRPRGRETAQKQDARGQRNRRRISQGILSIPYCITNRSSTDLPTSQYKNWLIFNVSDPYYVEEQTLGLSHGSPNSLHGNNRGIGLRSICTLSVDGRVVGFGTKKDLGIEMGHRDHCTPVIGESTRSYECLMRACSVDCSYYYWPAYT